MNMARRIFNRDARRNPASPDVRLRISNLTRQVELAECVDVADQSGKRRKGLLGRAALSPGEGLWIVPCESVHTFGMKFPIDLVYLDPDKRVKKVRSGVRPWRLSACLSAHSVLELVSGSVRETGTLPGDRLEFYPALLPSDRLSSLDACDLPAPPKGVTTTVRQKSFRAIAEFLVVGIWTATLALTVVGICSALLGVHAAGSRDFVEYWASGHLLAHHANPYAGDAILSLERSVGYPSDLPVLIMWNPPPALLLVLPLGFIGSRAGELLWSLLLMVSLVASVRMVWIMHGRPNNLVHLLGYSFAPALVCLLAGQVSIFVLLGLVLFLRFHQSRPFLAGVSLWLCLLKPHLFLPFGVGLLAWVISTRSYKLLVGVAVAVGFSAGVVVHWDPLIWSHYGEMMRVVSTARMQQELIPCLSIMLRWTISPKSMWLQYLPSALGCIWTIAYFRKHRKHWDWLEHGSLLMLVSVLLAPYTWLLDQAVLIPALLHAAYFTRSRSVIAVFALASAVIDIGALRGMALLHSEFLIWTAPAWLAWYLYATRSRDATGVYEPSVLAGRVDGMARD